MKKRQKRTIGSLLEINIDNSYYVYAQIMQDTSCAFFDHKSQVQLKKFEILKKMPHLIYCGSIQRCHYQRTLLKVGKMEIRDSLKIPPMQFIEDQLHPGNFELYEPITGVITPASKEECIGLERAAVWEAEHVESRIRDFYKGEPNYWNEQLNIIPFES